jgi:hypothetical protein
MMYYNVKTADRINWGMAGIDASGIIPSLKYSVRVLLNASKKKLTLKA